MLRAVRLRKGDKLWVRDEEEVWREGVLAGKQGRSRHGDLLQVWVQDDESFGSSSYEEHKFRLVTVSASTDCEVRLVDSAEELRFVDDLTELPALHEASLLTALHERFKLDQIYTFAGAVLLALNPFKSLKGVYGTRLMREYARAEGSPERQQELPPHVYQMAARAYYNLISTKGVSQTILISGESGAGKTESSKFIMRAVTEMSRTRAGGRQGKLNLIAPVSDRVLQSNPILEAFGNAQTLRNDNSSRFGKLINLRMEPAHGVLKEAHITTYLLEKARLTEQNPGERNFHVFYAMGYGASQEEINSWQLHDFSNFIYLSQLSSLGNADKDEDQLADRQRYENLVNAMRVLDFTEEEILDLFKVVAGVLHLGNLKFAPKASGEGSRIAEDVVSMQTCAACCDLLEIDADALELALCMRIIRVSGPDASAGVGVNDNGRNRVPKRTEEIFAKDLTCSEASAARDALAMTLYERLFGWIVWKINSSLQEASNNHRNGNGGRIRRRQLNSEGIVALRRDNEIGILDVFGFEVFEGNGFEQLCINYCNERLQSLFNEFVLLRDQVEYDSEGIDWQFIEFPDNSACLDLIESRPIGLMALIDENCLYPHSNDQTLVNKMYSHLPKQFEGFLAPTKHQRANKMFTISHFAGNVTYSAQGFTRKNKNELRQEAVDLLNSSEHPIVSTLLPNNANDAAGGADLAQYFEAKLEQGSTRSLQNGRVNGTKSRGKMQQKTVVSHFKEQLDFALGNIRSSQTHYVRCLKPNDDNVPDYVARPRLIEQLRYSGVIQIIQVARAGYPSRMTFDDFLQIYSVLVPNMGTPAAVLGFLADKEEDDENLRNLCLNTIDRAGLVFGADFQIGVSKVFLRQSSFASLEISKAAVHNFSARVLQRAYRSHVARKVFHDAAVIIQTMVRRAQARDFKLRLIQRHHDAAQIIQLAMLQWLRKVRRFRREEEARCRRELREREARRKRKLREEEARRGKISKKVTFSPRNIEIEPEQADTHVMMVRPMSWSEIDKLQLRPAIRKLPSILSESSTSEDEAKDVEHNFREGGEEQPLEAEEPSNEVASWLSFSEEEEEEEEGFKVVEEVQEGEGEEPILLVQQQKMKKKSRKEPSSEQRQPKVKMKKKVKSEGGFRDSPLWRLLVALLLVGVTVAMVFSLGGDDQWLTYMTAVVMSIWILTHVPLGGWSSRRSGSETESESASSSSSSSSSDEEST